MEQKLGFIVAFIENVNFHRPLFMAVEIEVHTLVESILTKSMKMKHTIFLDDTQVFSAIYNLVLVSTEQVQNLPLSSKNVDQLKTIEIPNSIKDILVGKD